MSQSSQIIRTTLVTIGLTLGLLVANLFLSASLEILLSGDLTNICNTFNMSYGENFFPSELMNNSEDLIDQAMPGVRCPSCAARGLEQWVLPGKHCPRCSTAC